MRIRLPLVDRLFLAEICFMACMQCWQYLSNFKIAGVQLNDVFWDFISFADTVSVPKAYAIESCRLVFKKNLAFSFTLLVL
jgi:hypothetical protein